MRTETTVAGVRAACADLRRDQEGLLGLVPTMGALHAGHMALVRACKERCAVTAVSLFVNPTQFGPNEDLARYPRTLDADCELLQAAGVDLLFAPGVEEIYPPGGSGTYVEVEAVGNRLDGVSRPGHFRGVATVVTKLLHIVSPDVAFFGQKDAAQVAVLRAMARDLFFATKIEVCPTVRESDGLALSSRNRYLGTTERVQARALYASLRRAEEFAAKGVTSAQALQEEVKASLESAPGVRVEYVEIVDPETLLPVVDVSKGALIAVAAWVGGTRLIDNIVLHGGAGMERER